MLHQDMRRNSPHLALAVTAMRANNTDCRLFCKPVHSNLGTGHIATPHGGEWISRAVDPTADECKHLFADRLRYIHTTAPCSHSLYFTVGQHVPQNFQSPWGGSLDTWFLRPHESRLHSKRHLCSAVLCSSGKAGQ